MFRSLSNTLWAVYDANDLDWPAFVILIICLIVSNEMNHCIESTIDVNCNEGSEEDSDNYDSGDSFDIFSSEAAEDCQFIQRTNSSKQSRNMFRRITNYTGPKGFSSRHNISIKRFLVCFGLTSSLIILVQIYLSTSYEYSLEGV